MHRKEDVLKITVITKGIVHDREINRLRLLGDYYHNLKVLSVKSGKLIVVRRPINGYASFEDSLPCCFCKSFFFKFLL